jgi:elongation factor P
MYSTTDFKRGLKIEIDGEPWVMTEFQHVKPGKGVAFIRTRIKSLVTGRTIDKTFRSGDKVDKPNIEELDGQFLYADTAGFHFMNTESYEQITIPEDVLDEVKAYLKDNMVVKLLLHNGRLLNIDPPTFVELKVTEAEPGVKGDTASGATKTVTLETGLKLNVPLFINLGETLKIDTRDGSYVDRVK